MRMYVSTLLQEIYLLQNQLSELKNKVEKLMDELTAEKSAMEKLKVCE